MDAFYAAVEQRDDPSLRGQPVAVGGSGNRAVVAAASYEARAFGVHSAMPMREARRRCPRLVQVPVRMAAYKAESKKVFAIFRDFTPLVEGLSLDEAFLDVSASIVLFGPATSIATAIKQRIREVTGLTASVGVAPNKLVAKIASDLDKPDGMVVVDPENVLDVLDPLPAGVIPGIGTRTLARLREQDILTIRDLRSAPASALDALFGRHAERVRERASGIDNRPVNPARDSKSISSEETFDEDLHEWHEIQRELLRLAERTAARLRTGNVLAATVTLKIRQSDFATFTRQQALHPPSNDTQALYKAACSMLLEWQRDHAGVAIRLLGVGTSGLAPASQYDLFDCSLSGAPSALDRTVDDIRKRFSSVPLGRARTFGRDQIG